MYKLFIQRLLFLFDPELSHHIAFKFIKVFFSIKPIRWVVRNRYRIPSNKLKKKLFNKTFTNPVGLAAGFDKNSIAFDALSCFGFGFIEIGTVTPKPQKGNPTKRIFRLVNDQALINRMGFNNDGADIIAQRIEKINKCKDIVIGVNIGKNKSTPIEKSISDYLICFRKFAPIADYIAINVSSPNTPELRSLQKKNELQNLVGHLVEENRKLKKSIPLLLKISPDLSFSQIDDVIQTIEYFNLAGIIAVNTTTNRINIDSKYANQSGGLSGKPLFKSSIEVVSYIKKNQKRPFCIIGVGGIQSSNDALKMLNAGADLIQIYTGFVYQGPRLVKNINQQVFFSIENN